MPDCSAPEPAQRFRPFLVDRLDESFDLRAKVAAARQLGISVKRFDGWEPKRTTTYRYDDDGRLVESITFTEEEWDPQQQAWMLALHVLETDRCPGCGGRWSDTTHPDNQDAYTVPDPVRCHSCTAKSIAEDKNQNPQPHALYFIPHLDQARVRGVDGGTEDEG